MTSQPAVRRPDVLKIAREIKRQHPHMPTQQAEAQAKHEITNSNLKEKK